MSATSRVVSGTGVFWGLLLSLVLGGRAEAQEQSYFAGWAADGRAILRDDNEDVLRLCKPGGLKRQQDTAEECQECSDKKACRPAGKTGKQKASMVSPDRQVKLISKVLKAKGAITGVEATVLAQGQVGPNASTPRIVILFGDNNYEKVRVSAHFRPDSQAVALQMDASGDGFDESKLYTFDLGAARGGQAAPDTPASGGAAKTGR